MFQYIIKNYYNFWWSQELSCLKDDAIKSNKIWKDAGRPRSGPIANKRNADKRFNFWKCWRSKFEKVNKTSRLIDGLADDTQIAEKFADFFSKNLYQL